MESKLYLVLAILFVFVIYSTSVEEKRRPQKESTLDAKKKLSNYGKDADREKVEDKTKIEDTDDHVDDTYLPQTSYAQNRYSPFNSQDNNYRTRSRWPGSSASSSSAGSLSSLYDDLENDNEWSRSVYGNGFAPISPSTSYDNEALLGGNGPTCHSLVDAQYPIFSDTCGAVPQARYSLPNSFGHRERWSVAQSLNVLMSSTTDQTCTRSLRLLLCPVLFPPCPSRHEPPPVLPCQSYCRAVKARCSMPSLDLLPCEVFPYSSDFCPTNQQYGSFMPQGPLSSGPQQFQMPGGFPSSNSPSQRSFPSLQSLLSLAGLQSGPTPSFSPFNSQQSLSPFNPQQSQSPFSPYNSGSSYGSDSLSSMLSDYPSRSHGNDYRQSSKYAPYTRSSTETRPTAELRNANEARPAAARSPIVKA